MDPLSLIANIIAVANAAKTTARSLERLASIRHAPQQILQLINEVRLSVKRRTCTVSKLINFD